MLLKTPPKFARRARFRGARTQLRNIRRPEASPGAAAIDMAEPAQERAELLFGTGRQLTRWKSASGAAHICLPKGGSGNGFIGCEPTSTGCEILPVDHRRDHCNCSKAMRRNDRWLRGLVAALD